MITHLGGRPSLFGGDHDKDKMPNWVMWVMGLLALCVVVLSFVAVVNGISLLMALKKVGDTFANVGSTIKSFLGAPGAYPKRLEYQSNGGESGGGNNTSFMWGPLQGNKPMPNF